MITTNPYLFVYGTLLTAGNPYANYLQKHCKLVGAGKFKGSLYNIGEYPGAIGDITGKQYVYGCIYLMDDAERVLTLIDGYEGIGVNEPQPHEYLRRLVGIETDSGVFTCWVYLYNWPVRKESKIAGGSYLEYINKRNQAKKIP
ncbi:gamma-glutamylcyclotransferase family protein [Mucilaginibacter sp. FT3.2]|uniref:gamma-glutamylcyclotransferase family protein n=1 Tax=Mucilaginibacter sp. FT3.2 TaxID=2723090 RepID=UPI00161D034B|nr:gamma-glutamylcyclotransferase family protein [Mucilaginibacter sp. FT3.2]MBB6229658.1 gamma-glutamylcyclotransferase (GGCT)/AIG2-like uncharacterized protein YtfP [Mucilaginibacter sp. FT3.2]